MLETSRRHLTRIHDSGARVREFANIATEERWQARLEHGNGGLLHRVHINIDVSYGPATEHVSEAVYCQQFSIRVPGVVDQTEELVDVRPAEIACKTGRGKLFG